MPGTLSFSWFCQDRNLKDYNQDDRFKEKGFLDLNQLARNGRGRAETKDGALPTLTCNSGAIYGKDTMVTGDFKISLI